MPSPDLSAMRSEYTDGELSENSAGDDPVELFDRWFAEAVAAEIPEPNAMALATASPDGVPSVRFVLLKGIDRGGPVFYTNTQSRKGREITVNPSVAIVFPWHPMQRQVRIEGTVLPVAVEESDAYFASRPEAARTSAWASPQSQVVDGREELLERWRVADTAEHHGHRPPFWGGFRVEPTVWEFWQGRQDRFHDRIRFTRSGGSWQRERLAP